MIHSQSANLATSIQAIANLAKDLSVTDKKVFREETVSLRFSSKGFLVATKMKEFIAAIEKCCHGVSGYVHSGNSPGFFLGQGFRAGSPTFSGPVDKLHMVLVFLDKIFPSIDKLSLRVTAPTQTTLQRLIDASWSCETKRGTLGADFEANSYFAVKDRKDMMLLLQAFSKVDQPPKTNSSDRPPFKLTRLGSDGSAPGIF